MLQYPRLEHLVHEFGHVWGLPHNYSGGLWSLMGHRTPNISSFMNSYEREQLGWINFNNVSVDGTTATISDFATTGVAYRITIPNTNPQEYFLFENHQQIALYDTVDISSNTGPGMYILQDYANNLRVASADGRWDWSNPYWIHNPYNPNPLDSLPVFKREQINRAQGYTDKVLIPHTKNGSSFVVAWLDEHTGQLKTDFRYKGDGKDRFTLADNNVFSPWSGYAAYNWNGTVATTIGMEITGTSGSNINVKFYTTTPINAAPSKPQNMMFTYHSIGGGSSFPKITWTANSEPDVNPGGYYRIERRLRELGNNWTSWSEIASVSGSTTEFIDNGITLGPTRGSDSLQYRMRAQDTQMKLSNYTEVPPIRCDLTINPPWKPLVGNSLPTRFELERNYPNPFNPVTMFEFALPELSNVTLVIYDILGRQVAELAAGEYEAGYHSVTWNASSFASGVYLARFVARQIEGRRFDSSSGQATDASGAVRLATTQKLVLTK